MRSVFLLAAFATCVAFAQDTLPRRGSFGIPLAQLTSEAKKDSGLGSKFGLQVSADPPGKNGGDLKTGDIVIEVAGKAFKSIPEFNELVRPKLTQPSVKVSYLRDGKKQETTVTILPKPADEGPNHTTVLDHIVSNGKKMRLLVTKPKTKAGKRPVLFWIQGITASSVDVPLANPNGMSAILKSFSDDGWVTVRVDKEGTGDSEGGPAGLVNFKNEVDIYRQTLKKIPSYDFVDADRIYIFGHSMGGCQAPIVCNEMPVRGIITYGTVTMSWFEWQMRAGRIQGPLGGEKDSEADDRIRKEIAFYHYLFNEHKSVDWIVKNHPELKQTAKEQSPDGIMMSARSVEYMQQVNDVNYCRLWETLKGAKVLALYGENDFIALHEDQTLLAQIVNKVRPGAAEYHMVPGSDHAFRKTTSFADSLDKWVGKPTEFNPAILGIMKDWIGRVESAKS